MDSHKDKVITTNQGISLVNILVIFIALGLLLSVVLSTIMQSQGRARDTARIGTARKIGLALEHYESKTGSYAVKNGGLRGEGTGYILKKGTDEYRVSLYAQLRNAGYLQNETTEPLDPIYKDEAYFLGVCTASNKYSLYLHVESSSNEVPRELLEKGCDGKTASTLGFNYVMDASSGGISGLGSSKEVRKEQ